MKRRFLSIWAVVSLLLMSVVPMAQAADEDTTSVTRIEAENYVGNRSSVENKATKDNGTNGETYLDDLREGQVLCLAHDIDLTGLSTVSLSVAHNGGGAVYALYVDGTKTALGTKIAETTIASTGGWQKFALQAVPFTADATPARLSGTHDLFLKVESAPTGSVFCGNFDATELTFGEYVDPLETVTVEAETFSEKTGSGGVKDVSGFSGGQDIDGTRNGSVFGFGEMDLTGLQSFSIAVGCQGDSRSYDLYIDGTVDAPSLLVAKAVAAKGSGNWNTPKTFEAAVQVSADQIAGVHKVFLKTNYDNNLSGSDYTGNIDYFTLTKYRRDVSETVFQMENIKDNADNRSSTTRASNTDSGASEGKFLDGTRVGDVFCLGDYDTTDLSKITLSVAHANSGTVYGFYIDGTAKADCANGYKIAELTGQYTDSGWRKFTEFSTGLLDTVSKARLQGTHSLFLKIESTQNASGYGGNMDYVKLTSDKPTYNPVSFAKNYSFSDALDASLSSSSGFSTGRIKKTEAGANSEYSDVRGVTDTKSGIQLAYNSVNFSHLKGITVRYMAQGATDLKVYKGAVAEDHLVTTLTLDNSRISGSNQWYTVDNLRTSYYDLSTLDVSGTDTLYFVPETTATYAGNYIDFTLYHEETLPSNQMDVCTIEGEGYVWGASNYVSAWPHTTKLDGTKNGDTIYLGKANIDNLEAVLVRAATAHHSDITYTLYADMDVAWSQLTATGVRGQYTPTTALTGGVELGSITVSASMYTGTNNWNIWDTFSCDVSADVLATLGSGDHEIYLKLNRSSNTEGGYCGNIDHIRFVGLADGAFDTTSNWPSDSMKVQFVGRFGEEVYATTVASGTELAEQLSTVKAPNLGGYTFCGWNDNAADADTLFDTYKNQDDPYVVRPVYSEGDNEGQRLTYTVTVGADIESTNCTIVESQIKDIHFDDRVELKLASDTNGSVAYWELDGQKVGYGKDTFTFYVTGANKVSVVLAEDGQTYEPETSVNIQQYATQYNEHKNSYVLTVIAQAYIPSAETSVEYGVYYTATTAELNNIKNGNPTDGQFVKIKSSKTGSNQQYMTHLLNVKADSYRYAIAYAIVDGETVFSPYVFQFHTGSDGTVTVQKGTI